MVKYTKAAIDLTLKDLRLFYNIFKYTFMLLTAGYFAYAIVTGLGNLVVNIILLSVVGVYFILDLVVTATSARRIIRHGYRWVRLTLTAFTLGTTIYGVYEATTNITPLSIILLTLMIVLWVVQFIFELITIMFEQNRDLILEAIEMDIKEAKGIYQKPVSAVKKFFNRLTGQEEEVIEPEENDSRNARRIKKHLNKKDR